MLQKNPFQTQNTRKESPSLAPVGLNSQHVHSPDVMYSFRRYLLNQGDGLQENALRQYLEALAHFLHL